MNDFRFNSYLLMSKINSLEKADSFDPESLEINDVDDSYYEKLDNGDFVTTPIINEEASFSNLNNKTEDDLIYEAEEI